MKKNFKETLKSMGQIEAVQIAKGGCKTQHICNNGKAKMQGWKIRAFLTTYCPVCKKLVILNFYPLKEAK